MKEHLSALITRSPNSIEQAYIMKANSLRNGMVTLTSDEVKKLVEVLEECFFNERSERHKVVKIISVLVEECPLAPFSQMFLDELEAESSRREQFERLAGEVGGLVGGK
eukprot:gnl/Chilomastix_caulleri/724.p1 GENE.gnl/Chilomastix_caulleri/724~~gnl/Chilomastix_caulleri/724.p1  ORF type:complete len:109 (+),score=28.53 gnl/Chilomastix_caulleri/724:28-354(+)